MHPIRLRLCLWLTAFLAFAPLARANDLRFFDDAALRAVQFVNATEGWAVGDDGVVWHTSDNGKVWYRQPTGTRASLRSVHFLNRDVGFVAGREELVGGGSAGVVLYTQDGGLSWRRILLNALPGLHVVRFVDDRTGYLAGEGSEQFPSGVFATTDGGRTWQPVPGPRIPAWRAGDFNAEGGALAGAWNRLATVRRAQVFSVDMDTLGGRGLSGLQLRGEDGVAVGQGGLVLLSKKSRGGSWHYADLQLPREVVSSWDFHAVGGQGNHIWAVGRPGSVALHSPDSGKTWRTVPTGQTLPLHGVHFRDEKTGWAVGELGTILATDDGGANWRVQRCGGRRLAALAVHGRAGGAILDTHALLGAQDGYLTGALCLTAPESGSAALKRASATERFSAALRQSGGAIGETLWQFPVGSHLEKADRQTVLKAWDRLHGDQAARQLLSSVVLALRMYRPDVVLCDHPDEAVSGYGTDALAAEVVREALKRAAAPSDFPEQLQTLHLKPHTAKALFGPRARNEDTRILHDLAVMRSRLGASLRELSAGPAALLEQPMPPSERGYRRLDDGPQAPKQVDLMAGVLLTMGSDARRALGTIDEVTATEMKAARERANLFAIADAPPGALTNPERLLAQIGPALANMPQDAGARVTHALAMQYVRRGQWPLARETFAMLADNYPTHPLAVQAYRWLLLHQGSSEARRRHEQGQFMIVGETKLGVPGKGQEPIDLVGPFAPKSDRQIGNVPSFGKKEINQVAYLATREETLKWYAGCLTLEKKLRDLGSLHADDAAIQFCVQAARRNLGEYTEAQQWYRTFAAAQPEGPWKSAAVAELWLANRNGAAPRPVLVCQGNAAKPYLDGKLDDPCWQSARPVTLNDAGGDTRKDYPTEARMTYDRDFLYLAVRCGHPTGKGTPAAKVRSRDEDLSGQDRVSVLLDLDRDYATCFHVQAGANGCVSEECWGDKTWSPRWFMAIQREATGWTLEAALPRSAFTTDHVTPGKAWAMNVIRVLPGRGVQAFSLPAEAPEQALRTEGLGLLLFTAAGVEKTSGR